eukprot:CAMPEP_0177549068 /NCGR_PEP_ID=MMETSP0369-20130122/64821_1 /TAXON_ID=447022 ORGANISM="Scrippsiella hangoei-like, Strain SHHI-4" /NCGR_SAMPLE_ID=MMETSP0369 /ASSEMBLY_ACC=CAM_ASM_000364 /LENGTH=146 /DNA_ID=CAMNT_0019034137 /DNA_START=173 /DNA_END=613 /DNA_ORIENTATION=+
MRGNEQLWYRSWIQLSGFPIQFLRGLLKPLLLEDTAFERPSLEPVANFARCLVILIATWSLQEQWRSTGTGLPKVVTETTDECSSSDGSTPRLPTGSSSWSSASGPSPDAGVELGGRPSSRGSGAGPRSAHASPLVRLASAREAWS